MVNGVDRDDVTNGFVVEDNKVVSSDEVNSGVSVDEMIGEVAEGEVVVVVKVTPCEVDCNSVVENEDKDVDSKYVVRESVVKVVDSVEVEVDPVVVNDDGDVVMMLEDGVDVVDDGVLLEVDAVDAVEGEVERETGEVE